MLEGEWNRAWKRVRGQKAQQVAEAQKGDLEGIRSETEAEKEDTELKQQRRSYLNTDLIEL